MYGMVNQAVESMVRSRFGDDAWEAIKHKAAVDVEVFVSNQGYPDDMTYQLVGAASEVLGLPPDDVLHAQKRRRVAGSRLTVRPPSVGSREYSDQ